MKRLTIAVVVAMLFMGGCKHEPPLATVIVLDTSASIAPRALKAATDQIRADIGEMQRGDLLVVIPITANAANDDQGRILRLAAPSARKAYDADLRRFREDAARQLSTWMAALDPHQAHTDILGALNAARQEVDALPAGTAARLIVVSDFLEDDGTYRFASDAALGTPARARDLAGRLRDQEGFSVRGIPLCLGRLESVDFARLPPQREQAVDAFWETYLAGNGAIPEIDYDGTGALAYASDACAASRSESAPGGR